MRALKVGRLRNISPYLSTATAAAMLFALFYAAWLGGYVFFTGLTDVFNFAIAIGVFMLTWNARRLIENNYFVWIGIGFAAVAFLDIVHLMAIPGIALLGEPALTFAVKLRLASKTLKAVTFITAPFFIKRKVPARFALAGFLLVSLALVLAIEFWRDFPVSFSEIARPEGPFSTFVQALIAGMLVGGLVLLWRARGNFDKNVFVLLATSLTFLIIAHVIFTWFEFPFDEFNLLGQYLRILSSYFIYKGIVSNALIQPYDTLFRDLKRSEESLRTERDFTGAVLNTAGAIVIVLDLVGNVVKFNRAGERMTGYSQAELIGRPFADIFLIETERPGIENVFKELVAGKTPVEHENYWVTKSGDCRLIHWANTVMTDAQGKVVYFIGTGIDVTERRLAEQQLKELNETLEKRVTERTAIAQHRAQQLRGLAEQLVRAEEEERQRIAQVLHDELQQLIVGAKMAATRLRVRAKDPGVREAATKIEAVLDNSINVSRSLTSQLSPAVLKEPGLGTVLDWLADWMRANFGLGVTVSTTPPDVDLTEEARRFVFRAVRELLFNVVKHSDVKIAMVTAAQEDNALWIQVEDEGRGFDPANVESGGGFGLLSIRERIEGFGGSFEIDSAPGRGTRMKLILPTSVVKT